MIRMLENLKIQQNIEKLQKLGKIIKTSKN